MFLCRQVSINHQLISIRRQHLNAMPLETSSPAFQFQTHPNCQGVNEEASDQNTDQKKVRDVATFMLCKSKNIFAFIQICIPFIYVAMIFMQGIYIYNDAFTKVFL